MEGFKLLFIFFCKVRYLLDNNGFLDVDNLRVVYVFLFPFVPLFLVMIILNCQRLVLLLLLIKCFAL